MAETTTEEVTEALPPTPPWYRRAATSTGAWFVRYALSFNRVALLFALFSFIVSLLPSLLPRSWAVQGIICGINAAAGYGVGVIVAWFLRLCRVPAGLERLGYRGHVRTTIWRVLALLSAFALVMFLWVGASWQGQVRHAVHLPAESRYLYLGVLVVGVLVAAFFVAIARLIRRGWRALTRWIDHLLPRVVSGGIAAVVVALIVIGFATNVLPSWLRSAAESVFEPRDHITAEGVHQPTDPERSGSPSSHIAWDDLGREGRTFVAGGPTAADIRTLTGRSAMEPIRVYAGRNVGGDVQGQANAVLDELKRTHAFDRAVLAVATTTGSGWVDPSPAETLEYLEGGDTAIAAMQYSYFPSWISFLVDKSVAKKSGTTLFNTVYSYWKTLPESSRPKLVVFGTSLGAFGGMSAFSSVSDLENKTDGALYLGPPSSTTLWREIVDGRNAGSPEVLPVIGDSKDVRFFSRAQDLYDANGQLSHPQLAIAQHGSDPIVWWQPKDIYSEPDWLKEPKASDVVSAVHWYPFITFWQTTADMIAATAPPPGYGHTYGTEVIAGWESLLHPSQWTADDTTKLAAQMNAQE
jgi:uncharacterized membrane protein